MDLKPGQQMRSQVCDTEVIVVRPANVELRCGGEPMIPKSQDPDPDLTLHPDLSEGALLGKRYTDSSGDLELLVTKPGAGTLSDASTPLPMREPRALPASD